MWDKENNDMRRKKIRLSVPAKLASTTQKEEKASELKNFVYFFSLSALHAVEG